MERRRWSPCAVLETRQHDVSDLVLVAVTVRRQDATGHGHGRGVAAIASAGVELHFARERAAGVQARGAHRHVAFGLVARLRLACLAAVQPEELHPLAARRERDEPVLRRLAVAIEDHRLGPDRAAGGGERDAQVVGVARAGRALPGVRDPGHLPAHCGKDGRIRPVHEQRVVLDHPRRGDPAAAREARRHQRGDASLVESGGRLLDPAHPHGSVIGHRQAGLAAPPRRRRDERIDRAQRNAVGLSRGRGDHQHETADENPNAAPVHGAHNITRSSRAPRWRARDARSRLEAQAFVFPALDAADHLLHRTAEPGEP